MKYIKKLLVIIWLCAGFANIGYSSGNEALMILIFNSKNVGEISQIKAVANSLKNDLTDAQYNVNVKEVEVSDLSSITTILQKYKGHKKPIIVAAGASGVSSLREMKSKFPQIFSVHLSHQIMDDHESLLISSTNPSGANLIVLPQHVITSKFEKLVSSSDTKLFKTLGVAHNLHISDLEKEYEKNILSIPGNLKDKYTIVILGGDSQNTDGSWLYFTKKDALKLAKHIGKSLSKDEYLLVLNSPRTGRHNPLTKEEDKDAHRTEKFDLATEAFVNYFEGRDKFFVYDFKYGKAGMYKPILGKVLHMSQSRIFVPGESTSMISEIIDNVGSDEKHQIFVYEHSAVSKVHKAHMLSEHQAGRVHLMNHNGTKTPQITRENIKNVSAAESIAADIMKIWGAS